MDLPSWTSLGVRAPPLFLVIIEGSALRTKKGEKKIIYIYIYMDAKTQTYFCSCNTLVKLTLFTTIHPSIDPPFMSTCKYRTYITADYVVSWVDIYVSMHLSIDLYYMNISIPGDLASFGLCMTLTYRCGSEALNTDFCESFISSKAPHSDSAWKAGIYGAG